MALARMGLSEEELTTALDELFTEGEAGARARARTAYDSAAAPANQPIVLFGAGQLGRMTVAGLRKLGIEPVAFIDSNARRWNSLIEGVRVVSPEEAARLYGNDATFIVTIWGASNTDRMAQRVAQLKRLGCRYVVTFQPLFWKHPDIFLPHYTMDLPHKVHLQEDEVRQAGRLWADDASRAEYLAQLRWRLLGDFDALPDPVTHATYFPGDLCPLTGREVFVDCGAYDGDTIRSFLEQSKNNFKSIYGFEPDPANFAKLKADVALFPEHDSIHVRCAAVGAKSGTVTFSGDGGAASHVGTGDMVVDCVTLDEVLSEVEPTYIKMDIEGEELNALRGARGVIQQYSPVLAICSYHLQNHVWKIPLVIQSFSNDYEFFLRPHVLEGWDLVTYAIPKRRLMPR